MPVDLSTIEFFNYGKEGKILTIVPVVMAEIKEIPKMRKRGVSKNSDDGFAFRGIDDALNFCGPIFAKYGLMPSVQLLDVRNESVNVVDSYGKPKVMNRSEIVLSLTLIADDGSWVRNICGGMATDSNDGTCSNKAHAAAMKYAVFFGLMVPVERIALEDGDADEEPPDLDKAPAHAATAGKIKDADPKPGGSTAEELLQVSLTAVNNAYQKGDIGLLQNMSKRALNNASFDEAQRNTLVKTIRELTEKLRRKASGTTTNPNDSKKEQK